MSLPSATTRLSVQSGSAPVSTDLLAVWFPCVSNADSVPRLWTSAASMLAEHGYCDGIEYGALHMQDAGKGILGIPLPIGTAGTVGRFNASGNTGTSVVTCAVGGSGSLSETDGIVKVTNGGTVGTSDILLSISLDGGLTYKPARLGTASTYVVPYVGLTVSFAGGTLIAGDTALTWHSTAPTADLTSLATAVAAMKAQQLYARDWLFVGDVATLVQAQGAETQVNAYETSAERYVQASVQLRDRLPLAAMSQVRSRMVAASLTFLEVGATGDTITRGTGSFATDGFVAGDTIRVTGSVSNNVTGVPASIAATVITLDTTDLANEGPVAGVTITAEPTLTFTDGGAGVDTIVRNRGSWLDDGFRVGDVITITGTASNNYSATLTVVTASTLTVATGTVTAEIVGSYGVVIGAGETDAAWRSSLTSTFASVATSQRVQLFGGRLTKASPITGYTMRRPALWADMIRAFSHDIRTTTWWKALGPLAGWGIDGEHDERVDGGLLDSRISCARTWGNGPTGAFIAQSLTRATDGSILGMMHNARIANLAQTVCQAQTEQFAGQVLVLQAADETGKRVAKPASLAVLAAKVNEELRRNLLENIGGEGQRASSCVWTPATDDDLGVANATLHGTCALNLNGTLVHISTVVGVR